MNATVLVLATQRLTQLVVEDKIAEPIRDRIASWGESHPEGSVPDRIAYLVSCPACTSVWAAGFVLLARRHPVGRALISTLATSAAVLAANAAIDKLER